jgi:hypothetical protein
MLKCFRFDDAFKIAVNPSLEAPTKTPVFDGFENAVEAEATEAPRAGELRMCRMNQENASHIE